VPFYQADSGREEITNWGTERGERNSLRLRNGGKREQRGFPLACKQLTTKSQYLGAPRCPRSMDFCTMGGRFKNEIHRERRGQCEGKEIPSRREKKGRGETRKGCCPKAPFKRGPLGFC